MASTSLVKVPVITVPADAAVALRTCVRDWAAERGYHLEEQADAFRLSDTRTDGPTKHLTILITEDGTWVQAVISGLVAGSSFGKAFLDGPYHQVGVTSIDGRGVVPQVHRVPVAQLKAHRASLIDVLRQTIPETVVTERMLPLPAAARPPSSGAKMVVGIVSMIAAIIAAILGYLAATSLFH
jgi:hypothetical protein